MAHLSFLSDKTQHSNDEKALHLPQKQIIGSRCAR